MLQHPATWIVVAYLAGSIPVGLAIGRLRGVDLRNVGSGNIGATNAGRAMGRRWGLFVFFLDVLKAWLPVLLASLPMFLGERADVDLQLALTGAAAFLGHVFPVYLRFRGGKGVAVALGVTLAFSPAVAAAALVLYLQTLLLTRISALGSLTAVTAMGLFVLGGDGALPEEGLARYT